MQDSNHNNVDKSEWKDKLTPEQYHILFEQGTEPPFTGKYVDTKDEGMYKCAACGTDLFSSETKYHSGSGWPSFWKAVDPNKIKLKKDYKLVVPRVEVECATCGGHLGHVFDDGPNPTGKRFCINSASLDFCKTA